MCKLDCLMVHFAKKSFAEKSLVCLAGLRYPCIFLVVVLLEHILIHLDS